MSAVYFKGRGGSGFSIDLWVGVDSLDMYQQIEGGFGSMRPILPM